MNLSSSSIGTSFTYHNRMLNLPSQNIMQYKNALKVFTAVTNVLKYVWMGLIPMIEKCVNKNVPSS